MQIKSFFIIFFIISVLSASPVHEKHQRQYTIIIDPAGDAKKTGRRIGDSFERGLTLQCAEKIKEIIEKQTNNITIIITRLPGDIIYELQNASLSNRLNADLFVHLSFYQTQETKPTLYLYQFSNGNDFVQPQQNLTFNSYDQAYLVNKAKTDAIIRICKQKLTQNFHHLCSTNQPYSLPIKALTGIVAPSIAYEIGLKEKQDWSLYVEPITAALMAAIEQ